LENHNITSGSKKIDKDSNSRNQTIQLQEPYSTYLTPTEKKQRHEKLKIYTKAKAKAIIHHVPPSSSAPFFSPDGTWNFPLPNTHHHHLGT
jgi:hypothetical protein